jgi:hypothetical protein
MTDSDVSHVVDDILARANLPVTEDERARLVRIYSLLREQVAALRAADFRYREPAVIFPAAG